MTIKNLKLLNPLSHRNFCLISHSDFPMHPSVPLNWLVDFDRTLINLDLGARFSEWVFAVHRVRRTAFAIRFLGAPFNVVLRKLNLRHLIRAWSFGLTDLEIQVLIDEFLEYIAPEVILNDTLLQQLRMDQRAKKVLLTGCSQELVTAFLIQNNLKDFDEIIGMTVCHRFIITRHPYGRSKVKISRRYSQFVAVGDSWEDRFILQAATRAIAIAGNKRLNDLALRSGWEVIKFTS